MIHFTNMTQSELVNELALQCKNGEGSINELLDTTEGLRVSLCLRYCSNSMYSTPPLHYSYWDDALSVSRQAYVVALGIWNPERGSYSTIAHYKNKESLRLLIQQQDTIYVPDRYNKRNKGDLDARYYPEEVSSAYNIFDESESAETADKRIVRQERYEMVMRHVNALPKHQREAVLGWMSEKKFREIGNVSKQATNKNFLKALRKLREDPIIRSLMY